MIFNNAIERQLFEGKFPMPTGVEWIGEGYEVKDSYANSYACDRFVAKWAAWRARAAISQSESAPVKRTAPLRKALADWEEVTENGCQDWPEAYAVIDAVRDMMTAPEVPIHPSTRDLVERFSHALMEKLAASERKYGYTDGWASPDWLDECRQHLLDHVAKGDPRDVAAYCAFLWYHKASTATPSPSPAAAQVQEAVGASERIALLETALTEVLEFQSAHEGPHIFDWGRWRRIRDNTPPFQRAGGEAHPLPVQVAERQPLTDEGIVSTIDAVEFRREQYGLNCRQWSAVLGIPPSKYSEFIHGNRSLPKVAMALAYTYGVPAEALFQQRPTLGAADIARRLAQLIAAAATAKATEGATP